MVSAYVVVGVKKVTVATTGTDWRPPLAFVGAITAVSHTII